MLQLTEALYLLNLYGPSALLGLFALLMTLLARRVLRLPPRVDFYVLIVAVIWGSMHHLQGHAQKAVRRITTAIQPDFYETLYLKRSWRDEGGGGGGGNGTLY